MDIRWLFPLLGSVGRGAGALGDFLLTYAVHSTGLLIAAWALVAWRRPRWSPAAQHAIWSVALVAGFVTATVQTVAAWRPLTGVLRLTEALRGPLAAVQVAQHFDGPVSAPGREARRIREAGLPEGAVAMRLMVFTISAATVAVTVWAIGAAALLLHLGHGRRRLMRALASRRDARSSLAGGALRHLAARAGVRHPVALSTSDALPAPAAISRHEIVLPTRALHDLSLAEQEVVLAHELAHVVRRDTTWLRLATWIERLAWFQPLNRVARRQMQLSAEFAADAWAVHLTRQPLRLAQALARVAEWVAPDQSPAITRAPRSHAPFAHGADGSPLVERVRRLTAPRPSREGVGGVAATVAMFAIAVAAVVILPPVSSAHQGKTMGAQLTERERRMELRLTTTDGPGALPRRREFAIPSGIRIVRASRNTLRFSPQNGAEVPQNGTTPTRVFIISERSAS